MNHKREVHRHRVIAFVDQALGDVEGGKAFGQAVIAEQCLMHTRAAMGKWGIKHIFEAAQDIVGVEHCIFGHLAQTVCTMRHDVRQRAGKHTHLAVESGHASEAVWMAFLSGFFLDKCVMAISIACGKG